MIDNAILYCLKNRQFIKVLLILVTLVTLFFTMLPPGQLGNSNLYSYDKLGHFLIFFVWTLLYGLFMFSRKRTEIKLMLILLAGCFFGISVEIFQEILPFNRTMNSYDALADICGSAVAVGILFLIKKRYLTNEMEKQLKKI
ncbi:MAG: VanZ family protein [Balneolaceae bacterium]|nr:VanZ family protein [Balneolaceae bacterium]